MKKARRTLPLVKAVEAYLAELAVTGRSSRTAELYGCLLRALIKSLRAEQPVGEITRADILQHLNHLLEQGRAQSYVGLHAKLCKRFFAWLCNQGEIELNPLQGLSISPGAEVPVLPFTQDECQRLIKAAKTPMHRAIILLLLDCGMRASELANLRMEDIGEDEITIHGKGGKVRRLALNPEPQRALNAWLRSRPQQDGLVWPSGFDRKNLGNLLDALGLRAKVARVFPHRFRYTWVIRLRRAGVDLLVLQRLGGWTGLAMLERYVRAAEAEHAIEIHHQHSVVEEVGH